MKSNVDACGSIFQVLVNNCLKNGEFAGKEIEAEYMAFSKFCTKFF